MMAVERIGRVRHALLVKGKGIKNNRRAGIKARPHAARVKTSEAENV